jgi:HK97 family phage prohead protease
MRSYPLEDIRVLSRAQGSEYADGRTVEAYAAVFDTRAEIRDHEGHYSEVIDRSAFNKAIADSHPQGGRQTWRTKVFYNHGMTLYGTPSERFSMTLGSPVDIRVEDRGLLTVTRYNENPLAEEVLEMIRSGDITSQSFSGGIIRSDPVRPRRGYQPDARGALPTVRRLELGLKEYGPTPFPAYSDAAVLSLRSWLESMPTLVSTTLDEPAGTDTSPPGEAVPDEPPDDDGHSSRASQLRRHAILQRIAAARRARPGLYVPEGESKP